MFFNNSKLGFIITGVFFVDYPKATVYENGRQHSALSFRINGNSTFVSQEKEYFSNSGSIAYIPKGVNYIRNTNDSETLIAIHFDTFGEDENEIQIFQDSENLRPFFETAYKNWALKEYNKCMQTVYMIFDAMKTSMQSQKSPIPDTISAGVAYLENNFRSPQVSISDAAKLCHVSETYFRKLYKAHFGKSPITALLDLRFHFAQSLLRSGYYEVKQAASLSGFSDTKYFRTAFQKRFGITPSQYAAEQGTKNLKG
jgi:AraC-like DNA-binding protein